MQRTMLKHFHIQEENMLSADTGYRFEQLWRKSLADSGKTQDYIAKAMGVTRHTVSNWLNGMSCPTQAQGFEWFLRLGLQPLPYYLELLYPAEFNGIETADDEQIEKALHAFISGLTAEERRKLLYCCTGEHGGSAHAILDLVYAYLQLPIGNRIGIAGDVVLRYSLAERTGALLKSELLPNIKLLRFAMRRCTDSIIQGHSSYTIVLDDIAPHNSLDEDLL